MMFAIKVKVRDPKARAFTFSEQKTMYDGKRIAKGDVIFVFASENEGGPGLVATGIVTSAEASPKKPGIARQTPRVSITIRRTGLAKRRLGRGELKPRQLERRSPRDGSELQALSPGNEQDRGHFRRGSRVPPRFLLARPCSAHCFQVGRELIQKPICALNSRLGPIFSGKKESLLGIG